MIKLLRRKLTPLIYNGIVWDDYLLDQDGQVWSHKRSKLKQMTPATHGKGDKYPHVALYINRKRINVRVHRAVAETFIPVPNPPGVTKKDWENTPQSVKDCFKHFWEVNHIDHNTTNYHPSNLEWVSRKENIDKYHEYRKAA